MLSDCLNVYLYFIHMKYARLSRQKPPNLPGNQVHLAKRKGKGKRGKFYIKYPLSVSLSLAVVFLEFPKIVYYLCEEKDSNCLEL